MRRRVRRIVMATRRCFRLHRVPLSLSLSLVRGANWSWGREMKLEGDTLYVCITLRISAAALQLLYTSRICAHQRLLCTAAVLYTHGVSNFNASSAFSFTLYIYTRSIMRWNSGRSSWFFACFFGILKFKGYIYERDMCSSRRVDFFFQKLTDFEQRFNCISDERWWLWLITEIVGILELCSIRLGIGAMLRRVFDYTYFEIKYSKKTFLLNGQSRAIRFPDKRIILWLL